MALLYNRVQFTNMVDGTIPINQVPQVKDHILGIRSQITKNLRVAANKDKYANLNTLYQEFEDVLTDLIADPENAANLWKNECKFYNRQDGTIVCSCNGVEVTCGEHFPQSDMLVTTKLTREARVVIVDC